MKRICTSLFVGILTGNVEKGKTKECNGDERIEGGMLSDDKDEPMEEDKPVDEGKLTEDA